MLYYIGLNLVLFILIYYGFAIIFSVYMEKIASTIYTNPEGLDVVFNIKNPNLVQRVLIKKLDSWKNWTIWPVTMFFYIGYILGEKIYLKKTKGEMDALIASWVTEDIEKQ